LKLQPREGLIREQKQTLVKVVLDVMRYAFW